MIALYDHIHELRAELQGCALTRRERAQAQAELVKAIEEQIKEFNKSLKATTSEGAADQPPVASEEAPQ